MGYNYLETGVFFVKKDGEWIVQDEPFCAPSVYTLRLYGNRIEITSIRDMEGKVINKRKVTIPLDSSDEEDIVFCSEEADITFIMKKKIRSVTLFEKEESYFEIRHMIGDKMLLMLSPVEIKMLDIKK